MMNRPVQIVHFDLDRALPRTASSTPDRGTFAVFWYRGLPLGHRTLAPGPLSEDRLAAAALDAIAPAASAYLAAAGLGEIRATSSRPSAELEEVRQRLARMPTPAPSRADHAGPISVVVPTRERPRALERCLASVHASRRRPDEIVVVDNAPRSGVARRVVARFPGVSYVAEPRTGSSAARNAGVAAASGRLIAFVDDDETVHPEWLGWLARGFVDPRVALVTGLVLPAELETRAQRIFERRYSFIRGYLPRTFGAAFYRRTRGRGVPVWEIGGSGNLAIRRRVFERLGGFDEDLGAGRAGGCEELELFYRALAAGWDCRYEPRAVTHHRHRRDRGALRRQLYGYLRGHVTAALTQAARHRDRGNFYHLLVRLPAVYARYGLRALAGDPAFAADLLAAEIAGCVAGFGYYRRHRSRLSARPSGGERIAWAEA